MNNTALALTPSASWLNSSFASFDETLLSAFHQLNQACGNIFDPFFFLIAKMGEAGAAFLIFAIVLLFFKATRKAGLCIIVAILIGALITNVCLKGFVARPRPYVTSELYRVWWTNAGAYSNSDLSFPSGHVTAATAAMIAWFLSRRTGKAFTCSLIIVLLMCIDRMYLIVHYPSDVIGGLCVGLVAGLLAYLLVSKISSAYARCRNTSQTNQ